MADNHRPESYREYSLTLDDFFGYVLDGGPGVRNQPLLHLPPGKYTLTASKNDGGGTEERGDRPTATAVGGRSRRYFGGVRDH